MYEKTKRRPAQANNYRPQIWLSVVLAFSIILVALLGNEYQIPQRFTLPLIIVGILVLASMLLWQYRNTHAHGDEWWQDDSASGWRGY